ncbi:LysM peptidoglycan-binding domain-containing protein [Enterococcus sp. AZ109]|uniref:aggregation-promoting factor n=1 Tax=Enterococcus sp. AZ109 TaxID=2774634 RepID=UPI003F248E19
MKFGKALLLSTLMAAGASLAFGTNDAHAAETYTVESGDTLSKISAKFVGDNSLVNSIAANNNITNMDLIFAGQVLNIDTAAQNTAAPVQETAPVQEQAAPAAQAPVTTSSAKEWIAQKESSGSYDATNGRYIGRYQLDSSYLNGDYSPANQERVADQYVAQRYGSWEGAQAFWMANGWY